MLITASFLNYSIDKFDVMIYITSMININKNYEVKVMSNKINSKNKFTPEEMNFIREDYNLTDVEFIDIFFKN